MIVGQGPIVLAVAEGGGCLDIFTLLYPFSPLSPSLWETTRYRLKYCLKGPLNPKQQQQQSLVQRCVLLPGQRDHDHDIVLVDTNISPAKRKPTERLSASLEGMKKDL